MAWVKRNLIFTIICLLSLGVLGVAGFYNYKSWHRNTGAIAKLDEIYTKLREITKVKPSPGNERVDNIKLAREQENQVREWIRQAGNYFLPIAPVPNTGTNAVSGEAFAAALRRTVDQLQHEAETASVALPPKYNFSFEAQRSLVTFAPGSLGALAVQFGEVKTIAEILFAARVNSLDGIQRVRVSADDTSGPQADYFEGHSETTKLAVITPYQVTFRSFSPEVAQVLSGFASSQHGFVVKSINVQLAGAATGMSPEAGGPPPPGMPATPPPGVPGKGGLQTVLNEQLLRVTLVVDVVKLLPQK